jgi:hypothetical protein
MVNLFECSSSEQLAGLRPAFAEGRLSHSVKNGFAHPRERAPRELRFPLIVNLNVCSGRQPLREEVKVKPAFAKRSFVIA